MIIPSLGLATHLRIVRSAVLLLLAVAGGAHASFIGERKLMDGRTNGQCAARHTTMRLRKGGQSYSYVVRISGRQGLVGGGRLNAVSYGKNECTEKGCRDFARNEGFPLGVHSMIESLS